MQMKNIIKEEIYFTFSSMRAVEIVLRFLPCRCSQFFCFRFLLMKIEEIILQSLPLMLKVYVFAPPLAINTEHIEKRRENVGLHTDITPNIGQRIRTSKIRNKCEFSHL